VRVSWIALAIGMTVLILAGWLCKGEYLGAHRPAEPVLACPSAGRGLDLMAQVQQLEADLAKTDAAAAVATAITKHVDASKSSEGPRRQARRTLTTA